MNRVHSFNLLADKNFIRCTKMCHGLYFYKGALKMTCRNSAQSANNIWANQEETRKGLPSLDFFALRLNILVLDYRFGWFFLQNTGSPCYLHIFGFDYSLIRKQGITAYWQTEATAAFWEWIVNIPFYEQSERSWVRILMASSLLQEENISFWLIYSCSLYKLLNNVCTCWVMSITQCIMI